MTADELRALQAPMKAKYKADPDAARIEIAIKGVVEGAGISCRVESPRGPIVAGLHEAAGGDGTLACSADMLLESLVACAGVTLKAVATALGIELKRAEIMATGDLDFRGTLGVSKEAPVGLSSVRLHFNVHSNADDQQLLKLLSLVERYCVIYQTLAVPPRVQASISNG